jgi:hypothetical protein
MKSLNKIVFSLQEIWAATRPNVFKNKKNSSRKNKHKASLK